MVPARRVVQPADHVDAVGREDELPVVEVVLLGREHRDRRAGLLTRIGGLLGGDARTQDQDRDDQQTAGVHGTLPGERRFPRASLTTVTCSYTMKRTLHR